MSLFGAMNAGVSGLVAQSSAMGAISDNITNVNTVGYKSTKVNFQTLVTAQASASLYSSGGVVARPRGGVDTQGLLQSSPSSTDLAISGEGFFVVNKKSDPGTGDQFLFTRAGSFIKDDLGYLRNTAGFYLQAWPTDRLGNVILPDGAAGVTNQNIISSQFLETVNLNTVGGTAEETNTIAIGANLPAGDAVGDTHNVDVQFFDSLGNTNAVAFTFGKSATNQWDLTVQPPTATGSVTLYDSAGAVYNSIGQLEFSSAPVDGDKVTINGNTYEFDTAAAPGAVTAGNIRVDISGGLTGSQAVQALATTVIATDVNYFGTTTALGKNAIAVKSGSPMTVLLTGGTGIDPTPVTGGPIAAFPSSFTIDAAGCTSASQSQLPSHGTPAVTTYSVYQATATQPAITFNSDGLPSAFGVSTMEVDGFLSGAGSMLHSNGEEIKLKFGTVDQADGVTQLAADFTPNFIQQDGARFGVFSGVTVGTDGIVSALFDNGERRPIYKVPLVTFSNPDGLESKSGNVWIATEASGNPTLRLAGNGSAGQIAQSSLEASTVDIGQEFTDMIVVQRAYSAATKIISTADEMLDELVHLKR